MLTGCLDMLVAARRNEKNQIVRKDGTYYLFDMPHIAHKWNDHRVKDQLKEIEYFIDDLDDDALREELATYFAETVLMMTSIPNTVDTVDSFEVRKVRDFPANTLNAINASNIKEEYKSLLCKSISKVIKGFCNVGAKHE